MEGEDNLEQRDRTKIGKEGNKRKLHQEKLIDMEKIKEGTNCTILKEKSQLRAKRQKIKEEDIEEKEVLKY